MIYNIINNIYYKRERKINKGRIEIIFILNVRQIFGPLCCSGCILLKHAGAMQEQWLLKLPCKFKVYVTCRKQGIKNLPNIQDI
jgi:hypothetical protein